MSSRRSKNARRKQKRRPRASDARATYLRAAGPEKRLKPLFETLDRMVEASHEAALSIEAPDSRALRFELAVFTRAINTLKIATQLLRNQHWEFAAVAVRQLYELVLNIEWLDAQPNRDEAMLRFVKFGLLQRVLGQLSSNEYDKRTGRPFSSERNATLQALLAKFAEFLGKDRSDGTARWHTSWSGKTVRGLAEASPSSIRLAQYEQLYQGDWSEQTHVAPVVLLDDLFNDRTGSEWVSAAIASDDHSVIEQSMMLVPLYCELWTTLSHIAGPPPTETLKWIETVMEVARQSRPEQFLS
jgi:hypothetical protein